MASPLSRLVLHIPLLHLLLLLLHFILLLQHHTVEGSPPAAAAHTAVHWQCLTQKPVTLGDGTAHTLTFHAGEAVDASIAQYCLRFRFSDEDCATLVGALRPLAAAGCPAGGTEDTADDTADDAADPSGARLFSFLRRHGAVVADLEIAANRHGIRGLLLRSRRGSLGTHTAAQRRPVVAPAVAPGDPLISLPSAMIWNDATARESRRFGPLLRRLVLSDCSPLVAHMMLEHILAARPPATSSTSTSTTSATTGAGTTAATDTTATTATTTAANTGIYIDSWWHWRRAHPHPTVDELLVDRLLGVFPRPPDMTQGHLLSPPERRRMRSRAPGANDVVANALHVDRRGFDVVWTQLCRQCDLYHHAVRTASVSVFDNDGGDAGASGGAGTGEGAGAAGDDNVEGGEETFRAGGGGDGAANSHGNANDNTAAGDANAAAAEMNASMAAACHFIGGVAKEAAWRSFGYAITIVRSRMWGGVPEGEQQRGGGGGGGVHGGEKATKGGSTSRCSIVPLMDFLNHRRGSHRFDIHRVATTDTVVVSSGTSYAPGDEIGDDYDALLSHPGRHGGEGGGGKKRGWGGWESKRLCNVHLLNKYGFVEEERGEERGDGVTTGRGGRGEGGTDRDCLVVWAPLLSVTPPTPTSTTFTRERGSHVIESPGPQDTIEVTLRPGPLSEEDGENTNTLSGWLQPLRRDRHRVVQVQRSRRERREQRERREPGGESYALLPDDVCPVASVEWRAAKGLLRSIEAQSPRRGGGDVQQSGQGEGKETDGEWERDGDGDGEGDGEGRGGGERERGGVRPYVEHCIGVIARGEERVRVDAVAVLRDHMAVLEREDFAALIGSMIGSITV